MSKTRLAIVKDIISRSNKSPLDGKETIDESAKIQQTYIRKLQNDINLTSSFIEQADASIEDLVLKSQTGQNNNISLKKEIIALSDTYGKLPYLSEKGDVIGIATASTVINTLVQQQTEANNYLTKKIEKDTNELNLLNGLHIDYERILQLVDEKIVSVQKQLNEIRQKTASLSPVLNTNLLQINSLDSKLSEAYEMEDSLLNYLKRIAIKYLAFGDWEIQQVMTEEVFEENVSLCMQLIDNLVTSSIQSIEKDTKDDWVIINPNLIEGKLINHFLKNNLIISREDTTKDQYIIMLRSFGSEF